MVLLRVADPKKKTVLKRKENQLKILLVKFTILEGNLYSSFYTKIDVFNGLIDAISLQHRKKNNM